MPPASLHSSARRALPVGLVLVRATEILGAESFFHEFVAGVERVLHLHGSSVLLLVAADHASELATYRRWAKERRVSAVILSDMADTDPRPGLMKEIGMPAVVVGDRSVAAGLPAVWTDDTAAMHEAIAHIAGAGHLVAAHLGGPPELVHSRLRRDAFLADAVERGIEPMVENGDYSELSGTHALERLLASPVRPTAIICDNDLMAIGAVEAARRAGLLVPDDLSVIAWDDSSRCQLAEPPIDALSHDVERIGEVVGEVLLSPDYAGVPRVVEAPLATLVARGSVTEPRTARTE